MAEPELAAARERMVQRDLVARGVTDVNVVETMRRVPRHAFVPTSVLAAAYEDAPLPIGEGQAVPTPSVVARMVAAAELDPADKVLEVGTGSGYGAAVLAEIAAEVWTFERRANLAERARRVLGELGYANVRVHEGDGRQGCSEHAPFDAIVVTGAVRAAPPRLLEQLAVGGRLVVPVGGTGLQELVRIRRTAEGYVTEALAQVRLPALDEGEEDEDAARRGAAPKRDVAATLRAAIEPFDDIATVDLAALLDRIGDARVVLLGEATHGTSEFYRMRDRITRELVARRGFDVVAVEADWPDAARIDHYVRHRRVRPSTWTAFARFPQWMWRNEEMRAFVDWLHDHNAVREPAGRVAVHGLDLYSLYTSVGIVLDHLDAHDPEAAHVARHRYGCLTPFESDPAAYGAAVLHGGHRTCEADVLHVLETTLRKRAESADDADPHFDAAQNARLVAGAEKYYRAMYYGGSASWNLRDRHMFETLEQILAHRGPGSKVVVWAHNSHLGDARFTEMGARGELNLGQLCREAFGDDVYTVGFGTYTGWVAAASRWDAPMELKRVRPAHEDSYERCFHHVHRGAFLLPLRDRVGASRRILLEPRLERAIGVIYRPETELWSHYFTASLPRQFDEYCWFDETSAVTPLATASLSTVSDTYPFGL